MVELEREFYDQSNFLYLKRIIERDGFKKQYPLRLIWNKRIKRYEVFDGIHRLKVAQTLGISKVPVIDETETLTRQQAIAEGIKANATHAPYNPIDKAVHLNTLSKLFNKKIHSKYIGRPHTYNLSLLSELTGWSEKSISQYLQLLRLPEDVQRLVGEGKLHLTHALILLRLVNNPHKFMISKLAQDVVKEGISRNKLQGIVESILKKGYYDDNALCVGCERAFSKESMSKVLLCPHCVGLLRSRKIEKEARKKPNESMRKYLKLRHRAEQNFTKQGRSVPIEIQKKLEKLYEEWRGEKLQEAL
ncbi:MAG: ParB/RepB/Spo0J family partition protein [Candidatus Bathyarchaeia archaeon]